METRRLQDEKERIQSRQRIDREKYRLTDGGGGNEEKEKSEREREREARMACMPCHFPAGSRRRGLDRSPVVG